MLIYAPEIPIIFAIGSSLVAVIAFDLNTSINYSFSSFSSFVDWPIATYFIMNGVIGSLFGTKASTKLAKQNKRQNIINDLKEKSAKNDIKGIWKTIKLASNIAPKNKENNEDMSHDP